MRVATLRDGSRDGRLVVVDRAAARCAPAPGKWPTLQAALDDWSHAEPALRAVDGALARDASVGETLHPEGLAAPLPRAYEWLDGSSYLNHVRLVRKARGAEPPPTLETEPLIYQGGAGTLLGANDPLVVDDPSFGLDFEGELGVIVDDVPMGTSAARAGQHVRLLVLLNDVTLRNLVPAELAKGFGFFWSKPPTAFAPFAVTPDELGAAFTDARAHLRLHVILNEGVMGDLETGPEMHFSFAALIAHAARTRPLVAGTIVGSGTVSNEAPERGVSCLVEQRTRETLETGAPRTPYLAAGDRLRIEAFDGTGRSVFGAISQTVISHATTE